MNRRVTVDPRFLPGGKPLPQRRTPAGSPPGRLRATTNAPRPPRVTDNPGADLPQGQPPDDASFVAQGKAPDAAHRAEMTLQDAEEMVRPQLVPGRHGTIVARNIPMTAGSPPDRLRWPRDGIYEAAARLVGVFGPDAHYTALPTLAGRDLAAHVKDDLGPDVLPNGNVGYFDD